MTPGSSAWYYESMDLGSIRQGRKRHTRELERKLSETVERYQLTFQATNDVLYDLDLQEGTVVWNEALYTHYGYRRGTHVNKLEWWVRHVHPDDALQLEQEMSSWFAGKQDTGETEYRFRKADGSYINVRNRCLVQRAADGTPTRIIGSFLDITKQTQLAHAKDEFISLVSHQLRTPLAAIRVYSEMLESGMFGKLKAEQQMPVHQVTEASVRLIKLVDTILNISRIELGHVVSVPVRSDINTLLKQHIDEVLPLAKQRGVTLHFTPNAKVGTVLIDPTIFSQVVHNLLTNAIRYTKNSKGSVRIKLIRTKDGYLLSVKDNGIGIPESAQPLIFNRFYRADNAVDASEQGTGLGLYLIKLMTETTDCKIWFESIENKGTTFYIQIPLTGMRAG